MNRGDLHLDGTGRLRALYSNLAVVPRLVRFLAAPCTPVAARALLQHRVAQRDQNFLRMVQSAIWTYPASPYRMLLVRAGWTPDRMIDTVRSKGVEATLEILRDTGVFLTHDEFKRRRPIERDGLRLEVAERGFFNPRVVAPFELHTGGTRSPGSRVPASLDYIADQRAPAWCLTLEAVRSGSLPVIIWLPRNAGSTWWLALARMHRSVRRWFSISELTDDIWSQRRWLMMRMMMALSSLQGFQIAYPEHAPLSDGGPVLKAVLVERAARGGCVVVTSPSGATRLAGLAARLSTDLQGVAFVVGGEPLTPGKHAEITSSGARVVVRYNLTEAGAVGGGCGHPDEVDEVHLLADSFALIRHGRELPDGTSVDGLMLTTLLPSSPYVLLNVESDDFAQITERRCGCVWDEVGMKTHLARIRSFSKLTGEGMTVLGTDCVRVLEEVLPREFGGRSTDYQLLEVEDADHLTRLHLVVSPAVGPVDDGRLLARFSEALLQGAGRGQRLERWLQAGTIQVVRREPVPTAMGKLLPFHTLASSTASRLDVASGR